MEYRNSYGERTTVSGKAIGIGIGVIVVGFVGIVALCVLLATTWVSVDSSHAALVYNGGLFDSRGFDQMVKPGSSKTLVGISQNSIEIPVGVRQYRITNDEGTGADLKGTVPVTVRGVSMGFEPTILFELNTDDMPDSDKPWVADLYEKHLRQLGATDFESSDPSGSKWRNLFLNGRVYPVVKQVMQANLTGQDPVALRFDTDGARQKAADNLGPEIESEINDQLGGPYFKNVRVQISQPEVDAATAEMLGAPQKAKVEADNQITKAQEQTRQANGLATEAEAQQAAAARKAAADKANADAQNPALAAQARNAVLACQTIGVVDGLDCAVLLAVINGKELPQSLGAGVVAD